jgi:Bax protein
MKIDRSILYLILPLAAFCLLAEGRDLETAPRTTPYVAPANKSISPTTHEELYTLFDAENYTWQTLTEGVPPIVLTSLPEDLDRILQPNERKQIFFLSLLPLVLMANEEIAGQRQELISLLELFDAGIYLSAAQEERAETLATEYRVEGDPFREQLVREELLSRIDTLPPSMVLAQAATESGYGTSRFARMGNNLFGEWTFTPGTGIVPHNRPRGSRHEVRRFPTLYDSVRSYMKNINTHRAYSDLRLRRAELRAEGLPLEGRELARGLMNYSVRRDAYVREIRSIIGRDRLSLLASVSLRRDDPPFQKRTGSGLLSTPSITSRPVQLTRDQNPED